MHIPYTYLIGWSEQNKWYYGVRYAKSCCPTDLWVKYFTSSDIVKQFRAEHGEPDIIEIRKTFNDAKTAKLWEEKVLKRLRAVQSDNWLNKNDRHAPPSLFGHTHNVGRKQTSEAIEKRRVSQKQTLLQKFPADQRKVRLPRDSDVLLEIYRQKSIDMWSNRSEEEKKTIGEKIAAKIAGKPKTGNAAKGHKKSQEHIEKIRQSNIGKKRSKESVEKMRQSRIGLKQSEETKALRSQRIKELWERRRAGLEPMPNYKINKQNKE